MADKTCFTKDEWTLLLKSPMIAGMAITAADPSGLWGLLKESFAGGAALTKVAADPSANALIKAVVADFSTSEVGARRTMALRRNSLTAIRRVSRLNQSSHCTRSLVC